MSRYLQGSFFAGFLFACIILGGASRAGFLANLFLQLCAVGIIGWGLYRLEMRSLAKSERMPLILLCIALATVALQFIPLPYFAWSSLPGRTEIGSELELLGILPAPGFVTLSIYETVRSATAILPAGALILALSASRGVPFRLFAWTVLAGTILSFVIGSFQVLGGAGSPLYFYDFTNYGHMVGFFANANHMAALILISLPFGAALLKDAMLRHPTRVLELAILGVGLTALLALGIGLVGSMTGYILFAPVLFASALIVRPFAPKLATIAMAPLLLISAAGLIAFGDTDIFVSGDASAAPASREEMWNTALPAASEFFPVGSGLGTFEEVYPRFEDEGAVTRTFINHAHNDYLEIVIEMGVVGVALIAVFFFWWLSSFRRLLSQNASAFAWAAWIAIGVLLAHSAWDYPLRTAALSSIFAMCCVLIAAVLPEVSPTEWRSPNQRGTVNTNQRIDLSASKESEESAQSGSR